MGFSAASLYAKGLLPFERALLLFISACLGTSGKAISDGAEYPAKIQALFNETWGICVETEEEKREGVSVITRASPSMPQ